MSSLPVMVKSTEAAPAGIVTIVGTVASLVSLADNVTSRGALRSASLRDTVPVAVPPFSLIDADGIDPLLEVEAGGGEVAGIQQLNLGDHGVSLQPGVSYQWSVALVTDADSRATDLVASA